MAVYALVCPFLSESPNFAYGVEFGLLYARMQATDHIQDYFSRANQELILLLANRTGWRVETIQAWDRDWFWCVLRKG